MSESMAGTVRAQYTPHSALLVTLNQTKQRNGITGTTIAAAISAELRQPWPRWRIQTTIGTVMPAAMMSRDCTGYRRVVSFQFIRTMVTRMAPLVIIPANMTASISRKCRQKWDRYLL